MMDGQRLWVLSSPNVFQQLADQCRVEHTHCIVEDHLLRVGQVSCKPFDSTDDVHQLKHHQILDQPSAAWLDDDYQRLQGVAEQDWRTLWYNPTSTLAPDLIPVHDGEIVHLDDLAALPGLLAKPTLTTCIAWMDEWGLPDNIRRHVQLVARLAYGLGVLLRGHGERVDPILAHRGGLLHDLDKLHTLDSDQRHGAAAAKFLTTQGHPDLAEIVRGHILQAGLEGQMDLQTWEVRLVFFCDKLVEQDQIVPFDVRVQALKTRYPSFRGVMERAEPAIWALNEQICSILSIPSHQNLISILQKL